MSLEKFIGFLPDATLGGSTFDSIGATWATTPPVPTIFFPVTNVSPQRTYVQTNRDDEISGEPDSLPPLCFREAWSVQVSGKLYPYVAKRLATLLTGAADSKTGTPPAAITHKFVPIGFTASFGLPATHIVIVEDDLAVAFAGCQLGEVTFNFPLDGEATWTATFLSLYRKPLTGYTPPAETLAVEDWVYMARDIDVFLDGSVTAVAGGRGIDFTFSNQFKDPEYWQKQNRETVIDTSIKHILWHPARRKRGSRRTSTGTLRFWDVKTAEERRRDLAHAQKIVMECEAMDLATTPAAKEMLRITGQKMVYQDGGVSDMTADDDVTSEYQFSLHRDVASATKSSYFMEFVDATNTAITFAP